MPGNCEAGAYGCNHEAEHRRAAYKAWRTKRGEGQEGRQRRAAKTLTEVYGTEVTNVHTHSTHRSEVRFKMGDSWYTLPRSEFYRMERDALAAKRDQEREARRIESERQSAERKALRLKIGEKVYRDKLQRLAEREQLTFYQKATAQLRRGGISPSRQERWSKRRQKVVPVDYGEWETLPRDLRRRHGGKYDLESVRDVLYQAGAITGREQEDFSVGDTLDALEKILTYKAHVREERAKRESEIHDLRAQLRKAA